MTTEVNERTRSGPPRRRALGATSNDYTWRCRCLAAHATRLEVRRATLRDANMVPPFRWWCEGASGGLVAGLGRVELVGLLARDQSDLHQVERADEAVADAEATRAEHRVASGTAQ